MLIFIAIQKCLSHGRWLYQSIYYAWHCIGIHRPLKLFPPLTVSSFPLSCLFYLTFQLCVSFNTLDYTKEVSNIVFQNNSYHCLKIIKILHRLLGETSPLFTLFVNWCIPDDSWCRQPKHVVVLNKNQYIRSV